MYNEVWERAEAWKVKSHLLTLHEYIFKEKKNKAKIQHLCFFFFFFVAAADTSSFYITLRRSAQLGASLLTRPRTHVCKRGNSSNKPTLLTHKQHQIDVKEKKKTQFSARVGDVVGATVYSSSER